MHKVLFTSLTKYR